MDVRLEDGTIVTNVPDGMTQKDLLARLGRTPAQSAKPVLDPPGLHSAWPDPVLTKPTNMQALGGALNDTTRAIASGLTFGQADNIAAALASATGIGRQKGAGKDYASNLAAEHRRDAEINPVTRVAGELLGGIGTGAGLAKSGLTLLKVAKPTLPGMIARGAGEAAAYGAASGAGHSEGDLGERARDAVTGALISAPLGAAAGGVSQVLGRVKPPATKAIKDAATTAYESVKQSDVAIAPGAFKNIAIDMAVRLKKEGLDKSLHPGVTAALKRLGQTIGKTPTIAEMDTLRQVMKDAAGSNAAGERRLARVALDILDDHLDKLKPSDVVAGKPEEAVAALTKARGLWARAKKAETIEELIDRAKIRSSQFSGSGEENALRTEFRQLAMNRRKVRAFNKEEQAAIRRVAEGGPVANILRMVGKLAPSGGVVPLALGGGIGYLAGGPAGAGVALVAGQAGRLGAKALTKRNAMIAAEMMRRGGKAPLHGAPLTRGRAAVLRALAIAPSTRTQSEPEQ